MSVDEYSLPDLSFNERDTILAEEVKETLKTLRNICAPGPGGLPTEPLKKRPALLNHLLAYVFNYFLRGKELPPTWRTPIHSSLNNFRYNF